MKRLRLVKGLSLACLLAIGAQTIARADDLDEKQHKLANKINTAASTKRITGDDARELRKGLSDFNEKKKIARNEHDGVLTSESTQQLDEQLNAVSQDFETRLAKHDKKAAPAKSK